MSTPQRRWPKNAEDYRRQTMTRSEEARRTVVKAREEVKRNPDLACSLLSQLETIFADIQRWMVEAKQGIE